MIWAFLALLGIPIWIIAVVLIAVFRNRKKVRSNPDMFEYKLRENDEWKRGKGFARWVSDVLIFHAGIALIRSNAVQVAAVEVRDDIDVPQKGLGDDPTALVVTYTTGPTATIAVSAESLDSALGHPRGSKT
jgi:hypothetical protein